MNKSLLLAGLILSACSPKVSAPNGTIVNIYDGSAPGYEDKYFEEVVLTGGDGLRTVFNVTEPSIEIFTPENPDGRAMLVIPGGAFITEAYDAEGTLVAERLNAYGITAFVLKYRATPILDEDGNSPKGMAGMMAVMKHFTETYEQREGSRPMYLEGHELQNLAYSRGAYHWASREEGCKTAYEDADQAMRFLRTHAREYGIKKLGIMGFSAGAITSLHLAMFHSPETRPDFVGSVYGGWDETFRVPDDPMPLFVCSPVNDAFSPEESMRVVLEWRKSGQPVEYHTYWKAEHGFGAVRKNASVDSWMDTMAAFMKDAGF